MQYLPFRAPLLLLAVWSLLCGCILDSGNILSTYAQQLWANGTHNGIELIWGIPQNGPLPTVYLLRRSRSGNAVWKDVAKVTLDTTTLPESMRSLVHAASHPDSSVHGPALSELRCIFYRNPRMTAVALGIYYHDTTTIPLQEYDYQVWSGSTLIAVAHALISHQRNPPEPPTAVSVRQRGPCIELWWTCDSALERGVWGYSVYRGLQRTGAVRIIREVIPITFVRQDTLISGFLRDCSIRPGTEYTYSVVTYDVFGTESQPTHVNAVLLPIDSTPRTPVLSFHRNMDVLVAEHATTNAEIVLGGRESTRCNLTKLATHRINDTSIAIELPETTADALACTVILHNGPQTSFPSIPHIVPLYDHHAPECPPYVAVQHDGNCHRIEWLPASNNDIAGYIIECGRDSSTHTAFVAHPPYNLPQALRTIDECRVLTVDVHGNRSKPCQWIPVLQTLLGSPLLQLSTVTSRGIRLGWHVPSSTRQILVNRYKGDTLISPMTIAILPGTERTFFDRTHFSDSSTWYEIVAIDSTGVVSMPSNRVGITRSQSCTPPRIDSIIYRKGAVVLYWSSRHAHEFLIERQQVGQEDVMILARISETSGSFHDDLINAGSTYIYRLRCLDNRRAVSEEMTITIPP